MPSLVAHADWSVEPRKRLLAKALRGDDGRYLALAPEPVGPLDALLPRLARAAGDGTVLLGVDFPLGLPKAYAERAGIDDFMAELPRFGTGRWAAFYEVACEPDQVCPNRPFYPDRPGGRSRRQLLDGLGLLRHAELLRCCDRRTATRRDACALFWTLGGNQVGKAAISGWRDLVTPALRTGLDLAVWPFHGSLEHLVRRARFVLAETYPGEVYRHLGLNLRGGKRRQAVRQSSAPGLIAWAASSGVDLAPDLVTEIEDGFGAAGSGDDRFDAAVGLLGMLNVVLGYRAPGEPDDPVIRRVEGWILGQRAAYPAARSPRMISRLTAT